MLCTNTTPSLYKRLQNLRTVHFGWVSHKTLEDRTIAFTNGEIHVNAVPF